MVSGSQGQLVTDIIKQLAYEKSFAISSYDRQRLDVTDKAKLEVEFRKINPDFFIQGASYHVVEEINKNPYKLVRSFKYLQLFKNIHL